MSEREISFETEQVYSGQIPDSTTGARAKTFYEGLNQEEVDALQQIYSMAYKKSN